MRALFFLAFLGCALALQSQVEYTYKYSARIATGVQSGRPQYAGTGLKADVKVSVTGTDVAQIQVSNILVGEKNEIVKNGGRDILDIDYKPIQGSSLTRPFKAHFKRKDGQTVLEVPSSDYVWETNVRRSIVNFFRLAPITEPSSIPSASGGRVEPLAFSKIEDTFAGRCRVGYSITPASVYDIPTPLREDIQSKDAPKTHAGREIQLEEKMYTLKTSIDFSTCEDRVAVMQSGAANLTNVTDSSYKDAASRVYFSEHVLKGSPGKFRVETGNVEYQIILNPYGFETEKMVIVSNQTVTLSSTHVVSERLPSIGSSTKDVKTWRHQIHSPNNKPSGYSPSWIKYMRESQRGFNPVFYERMATGYGWRTDDMDYYRHEARDTLIRLSQRLEVQNQDNTEEPRVYAGSTDGRAAQELHYVHRILRTLTKDQLQNLDTELRKSQNLLPLELYYEAAAVASTGPTIDFLLDRINQSYITDNRTASIFLTLANNIQSPEVLDKLVTFVTTLKEEDRVIVSLFSKINLALILRRLCVSPYIRTQSHYYYVYGNKMCSKRTVDTYLSHLESRIRSSSPMWVKILNTIAVGDLGTPESLDILEKVARGEMSNGDKFLRFAAIHAMGSQMFDNTTVDRVFNIVQPIAESQVEDYRVRQVAYNTLLTWKPNVTFIERLAMLSQTEDSIEMQSFIYSVIDSVSRIQDPTYRILASTAKNLRQMTRYILPSSMRPMYYASADYVYGDRVGLTGTIAWLTELQASFPREIYTLMVAKYGRVDIPLLETVTFGNTITSFEKLVKTVEEFSVPRPEMSRHGRRQIHSSPVENASTEQPDIYFYAKLLRTSEVFLPLTNNMYKSLAEKVLISLNNKSSPQKVINYKYMNPIETNIIMPTPSGLFYQIEVSSPTYFYSNMMVKSYSEPSVTSETSSLPTIDKINIEAVGIAKAVFKINTCIYVLAPWTNKTVVSSIDNEKSISLPMKLQAETSLQEPAQIIWTKITPLINKTSEYVPIFKIRNIPYTSVSPSWLPSPIRYRTAEAIKKVTWLYNENQKTVVDYPMSMINTGLMDKVKYVGEAVPPFYQPHFWEYIIEQPSRISMLIASPTLKNYELSYYHNTAGTSTTKSIGLHLRWMWEQGSTSSPAIKVPVSASQPIDIIPEESVTQRQQKLASFSNKVNYEWSLGLNFTGSKTKAYEVNLIHSYQNRSLPQESGLFHTDSKIQLTLLESNRDSQRQPKTSLLLVYDRPQLISSARLPDLVNAQSKNLLIGDIAANVYEGKNLTSSVRPVADLTAKLRLSQPRLEAIQTALSPNVYLFNSTYEFFRLAVYDRAQAELKWTDATDLLKNVTNRVRDITEGYLFPKLVKNYLNPGSPKQMKLDVRRSLADDRVEAFISLPEASMEVERLVVSTAFDLSTSFAPAVATSPYPSPVMSAASPGDKCYVLPSHVRTFDGMSFVKKPSSCWTVLMKSLDEKVKITSKMVDHKQIVKIESLEEQRMEIILSGTSILYNNMNITEHTKQIKSPSGKVLAVMIRKQSSVEVKLPEMLEVELRDSHKLMIKLPSVMRESVKGICGNFNSIPSDDMKDIKGCYYPPSKGPSFAASWIVSGEHCRDSKMTRFLDDVRHYQTKCSKTPITYSPCLITAYPLEQHGDLICLAKDLMNVCAYMCVPKSETARTVAASCWKNGNAPIEVMNNLRQGYMTHTVAARPDVEKYTVFRVPLDCETRNRLTADGCFARNVYIIERRGPLICVSTKPTNACKPSCNTQDVVPTKIIGNCWNESHAPKPVLDGLSLGYISQPITTTPESVQEMYFYVPILCTPPY